jgi:stage II sporulation protein R
MDGVFMCKKSFTLILMFGMAGVLSLLLWLDREQRQLADDVLRLHVLANSDSDADQALKLEVRDRILAESESILAGVSDREQAKTRLQGSMEVLAQAGADTVARAGYQYPVTVSVEKTWFPTKQYADFALPAGDYTALRVVIGEGGGQNWWCVVFPPLCFDMACEQVEATAAMAGLSGEEIALITGEDGGYVIKFKLLELWDEWKQRWK